MIFKAIYSCLGWVPELFQIPIKGALFLGFLFLSFKLIAFLWDILPFT